MLPLIGAIFVASLLGSLHCAGMCGAFVAVAVGGEGKGAPSWAQAAYHGGRLVSYMALGAAAGAAGGLVNVAGGLAGVRPVAAALAGAAMVAFGVTTWLRTRGVHVSRVPLPEFVRAAARAGYRVAMRRRPVPRAFVIGLLTTLLPCGWLYAFAVTAAGTGSAVLGAVTMGVFWSGTLPVLVAIGAGVQRVSGPLARRLPGLTCAGLVAVGLYTLAGRAALDPGVLARRLRPQASAAPVVQKSPCCESHDDDR
jgi:sulfite exporter TauE/SafE